MLKRKCYEITAEFIEPMLGSSMGPTKGYFVLNRRDGKPVIEKYKVKGMLKEAALALREQRLFEAVERNVVVLSTEILYYKEGKFTRPVVTRTKEGDSKASIITSETLEPGTKFRVVIDVCPPEALSREDIYHLFEMAGRQGIGQWRKAGFGSFRIVNFKELDSFIKEAKNADKRI